MDADLAENAKSQADSFDTVFFEKYQKIKDTIESLMGEWEELHELIENIN